MKQILSHEVCSPTILVLIGLVAGLYLKTIKHLFISRCTKIDCCGVQCERDVINNDDAIELAESTTSGSSLNV